jgi:hypothetical protein
VGLSGMTLGIFSVNFTNAPRPEPKNDERLMKELLGQMDNATESAYRKIAATTNTDSIEMIKKQLNDSLDYYKQIHEKRMKATEETAEKYYYVGLGGYRLDHDSKFFIQNGTYNLAYVKWDTAKKTSNSNWKHGHYERKQIPVRYSADNEQVLVPVSHNQYKALQALQYVLCFVLLVGGLYFFVGIPIQVLLNISRGKAFDENNVRYFNIIARLFFVLALLSLFSPYIVGFFFRNVVPSDFKRAPILVGIWDVVWLFLISIAVFITGKAFQKGNTLQKEQDLTI